MNKRRKDGRVEGFTLLELLGYVVVLAVILNMSVTLFVSTSRLTKLGRGALEKIDQVELIHSGFIETVHEAQGIVSAVGDRKTGPEQVVLRLAPEGEKQRYAVFGLFREDGPIVKFVGSYDGSNWVAEYLETYSEPISELHFSYDAQDIEKARLVTLEFRIENEGLKNTLPAKNTFMANLGGWGAGHD